MSIARNKQLEYTQHFQIAVTDFKNQQTFCDTVKCMDFKDKLDDRYLTLPSLIGCQDKRHDICNGLFNLEGKHQVEVCWMFPITKDKYRLRCKVHAITKETTEASEQDKATLAEYWNKLSDDDKMSYRAAYSG